MGENEMGEIKQALMELTVNIKHMDTKQDEMINDVKSIKEAIYNPETGLYARVRDLEQWQENMSRVIWTVGLGFIGLVSKAIMEIL
jgi:L-ribulose-5-phosphate 3-epimerase UlaE|tara:strand:- start:2205 stop:2462 length:258 start_codon:yes stop_codon:yes gene_type:complete